MDEIRLHQFAEKLALAGFSQRTVHDYPVMVGLFLRYLREHENVQSLDEVQPAHITAYHTYLQFEHFRGDRQLSAKTVRTRLGVLKSFYQIMYREGLIAQDYAHLVVLPRHHKRLPRNIPSQEQVLQLVAAVEAATPLGVRDRAIVELLYATGIRNQELRALTVDDYDQDEHTLFVHGKGARDRVVPVGAWVAPYLLEYLHEVRPRLLAEPTETLFLTKTGRPFETDSLIDLLRRYAKKVDIEYITPHTLRHACATHLLKNGADIRWVQELLGHKDLGSTELYTHIDITSLKQAHKRFHPRERAADAG